MTSTLPPRPALLQAEAKWAIPIVLVPALLLALPSPRGELRFLVLNALAVLLALAALWRWSAGDRARRRTAVLLVAAIGIASVAFHALVHPDQLPTDLLTVLHQGTERQSLRQLDGRGAHAGSNFRAIVSAISSSPTLRTVVGLNLWLGLINLFLFFAVARQSQRPLTALGWTVLLLTPAGIYPGFSELPSNLMTLYLLISLPGWALLHRPDSSRSERGVAYALLSVLTILVAFTRPEMALIGVTALLLVLNSALIAPDVRAAWRSRIVASAHRAFVWLTDHKLVLALLCLTAPASCVLGNRGWAVTGVNPFDTSFVTLFSFVPSLLLPLGFALLLGLGTLHAVRHFGRFGGLPLSLVLLYRAFFAAQNGFYETFRYVTYLFPALLLLAMFGTRELARLAERSNWPSWWRRAASATLIMTWCVVPTPGVMDRYVSDNIIPGFRFHHLLFDHDIQRETRFLTDAVAKNPGCVFVARVVSDRSPSNDDVWDLVAFGQPVTSPIEVPDRGQRPEELLSQLPNRPSCVRLYRGLDCNLVRSDGCEHFVAGRRLVRQKQWRGREFNTATEYGALRGEIQVGLYE